MSLSLVNFANTSRISGVLRNGDQKTFKALKYTHWDSIVKSNN